MGALLFMTAEHPIYRTKAAVMHCAVRIYCVNWHSIVDAHDYAWARNMKRLLQETCKKVSVHTEKRLSDRELANL